MTATTARPAPGPVFALALASITLIGPLAVHLFMPLIPAVKVAFDVSDAMAQLTFSIALFGMSVATLFYGSLADRYGRRPVLLSGLWLFLAGSILCALAPTAILLVVGRLIQAVGAGCGMTLVRTVARDAYGPERLVKAIAYLTMFYTLGPMVAPVAGGVLVDTLGWRSVFGLALVVGTLILTGAYLVIYETRPRGVIASPGFGSLLRDYIALFSHGRFSAFVLQPGFNSGVFLTMASANSVLMRDYLQLPSTEFGLWFILFPIGYFSGNLISSRIGNRFSAETMVFAGAVLSSTAVVIQSVVLADGYVTPLVLFLAGCFVSVGQGISLPSGQAAAMSTIPRLAGTASGIGVFVQFFVAAGFTELYGLIADGTPGPMIVTTMSATVLSLAAGAIPLLLARRKFNR